MKNPKLFTQRGARENLSNLLPLRPESDIYDIYDAVEKATTQTELVENINKLDILHEFKFKKETETQIRLVSVDTWDNKHYLIVDKEKSDNNYLSTWFENHKEHIINSDWAHQTFPHNYENITKEIFLEYYLIPLIESNIEYDFNEIIDAAKVIK